VANFYCYFPPSKNKDTSKMRVLGNSVWAKDLVTGANCLNDFPVGTSLMDHVSWLLTSGIRGCDLTKGDDLEKHPMHAACYHEQMIPSSASSELIGYASSSYFPGHLDKSFVYQAIFVPLSERIFYTFIGIPIKWKVYQDADTKNVYSKWKDSLTENEKTKITNFETCFRKEAQLHMKVDVETRIFKNQLGSVLSFPANTCYHATVIPGISTVDGNMTGRD
jgi:hypothetical protein